MFILSLVSIKAVYAAIPLPVSTDSRAIVTVSDPETGATWQWDIPQSDLSINRLPIRNSIQEKMVDAKISFDATEYILRTLYPSGSATLNDDITITTGLRYKSDVSSNTVRIFNVFGSTSTNGNFYASNRVVYWRNPGAGVGSVFKPSTNSWNRSVDSTAGHYSPDFPPYSLLECEVHINGLTSYRNISVQFNLIL